MNQEALCANSALRIILRSWWSNIWKFAKTSQSKNIIYGNNPEKGKEKLENHL